MPRSNRWRFLPLTGMSGVCGVPGLVSTRTSGTFSRTSAILRTVTMLASSVKPLCEEPRLRVVVVVATSTASNDVQGVGCLAPNRQHSLESRVAVAAAAFATSWKIYGDKSWLSIHCHRSSTGAQAQLLVFADIDLPRCVDGKSNKNSEMPRQVRGVGTIGRERLPKGSDLILVRRLERESREPWTST
jgi:hypothetical protein